MSIKYNIYVYKKKIYESTKVLAEGDALLALGLVPLGVAGHCLSSSFVGVLVCGVQGGVFCGFACT